MKTRFIASAAALAALPVLLIGTPMASADANSNNTVHQWDNSHWQLSVADGGIARPADMAVRKELSPMAHPQITQELGGSGTQIWEKSICGSAETQVTEHCKDRAR